MTLTNNNNLRFSVIIINWNGVEYLKKFLPSVVSTTYKNLEVIIGDNASSDDSVKWVKQNHPEVQVIELDKNYGYAKGNNLTAKHATGDVLIFLNNDAVPQPDWISEINLLFNRYPDTAVIQPKMLNYYKPEFFDYAGGAGGFLDYFGFPWCKGRIFDTIERDTEQYDAFPYPIFWASGAAFCIRRGIFEKSSGFDEYFEFHMEEIDLCWRIQRLGYTVRYCPSAIVKHVGGGSLPTESPRKVYYNFRNSLIMLTKNYPAGKLPIVLLGKIFFDGLAGIKFLFEGKFENWISVNKAYLHFYKKLPHCLSVRGNMNTQKKAVLVGFQPYSIVLNYYLFGNRTFSRVVNFSLEALSFFTFTRADRK